MLRILILSDSLALPRNEPECTFFEDTWPALLSQSHQVFQFSKGGGLINEIANQAHYYCQYNPDVIILQYGIVDCAPRAYSYREEYILDNFIIGKIIRKIISKTITTRKLRKIRKKVYTNINSFRENTMRIISEFPDSRILAVGILPPSTEFEELVPGVSNNVYKYNKVLSECTGKGFVSINDIPPDGIMSDFHHLTKEGHMFVFTQIILKLNEEY